MFSRFPRARLLAPAVLAVTLLFGATPPAPAAAASRSEAAQIIAIAKAQLGDPYRFGATGPRSFDCSGLVLYAYRKAGDGWVLGRHHRTARQLYKWFKARGLASRHHPRLGDLVVWGRGSHIGIYIGHGRAISTLTRGVAIHRVSAFYLPFTAYLHTGMSD